MWFQPRNTAGVAKLRLKTRSQRTSAAERTNRPPTEAALLLALVLGRLRQLEPFLGDPQPRLFVERANDARGVFSGFLSLLAEPS